MPIHRLSPAPLKHAYCVRGAPLAVSAIKYLTLPIKDGTSECRNIFQFQALSQNLHSHLVLVLELGLVERLERILVVLAENGLAAVHTDAPLQAIMAKVFLPIARKLVDVLPQGQRHVRLDDDGGDAVDGQVLRLVHAQVVVVHDVQLGHLVILGH